MSISHVAGSGMTAHQLARGLPVWAALSAGGVAAFPVLREIEHLTVCADSDAAGIKAGRTLCRRYAEAGRFAEMVRPKAAGADMGDLVSRASIQSHGFCAWPTS